MTVRIYKPKLKWTDCDFDLAYSIGMVINRWAGTNYESGQRFKQRGADCLGAVFGVIDELDGRPRAEHAGFPHDVALHNRPTAIKALREVLRRYEPYEKLVAVDGLTVVEPGDVIITGHPGGGPGHIELVGANPNELWHATHGAGFHQGGWSLLDNQVFWGAYRILDKDRWSC